MVVHALLHSTSPTSTHAFVLQDTVVPTARYQPSVLKTLVTTMGPVQTQQRGTFAPANLVLQA